MNYLPPGSDDYAIIVGWDWWCAFDREHRLHDIMEQWVLAI